MRRHTTRVVPWLALLLAACGSPPAPEPQRDGVLVLEVGGAQRSLRSTLMALGRTVEPPHRWARPVAVAPEPSVVDPPSVPTPEPQPPVVEPPLPEPVEPAWDIVQLRKGETLIHVARRCLGDGRRYGEIMEWNGWSERDARRLREGQDVRIRRGARR